MASLRFTGGRLSLFGRVVQSSWQAGFLFVGHASPGGGMESPVITDLSDLLWDGLFFSAIMDKCGNEILPPYQGEIKPI